MEATLQDSLVTTEEAVLRLRADPQWADLVRDAYLGRDVAESARRFRESGEFAEVLRILGGRLNGASVLDLGAGIGMASMAFATSGAARVMAVDPDPSEEIGRGAMQRLAPSGEFEIVDGFGEAIPLEGASLDIVYCRQVLHHAGDLSQVMRECARVLKPGGILLACREHVVDGDAQLRQFLDEHPVNRLAGGENAHPLETYLGAIAAAGLILDRAMGPWESVINAYPGIRTQAELEAIPEARLVRRLGLVGHVAIRIPAVRAAALRRIDKRLPGRLYTFVAHRPA
jgi:ubiquinone/menaquinone biosynthesis C-methylase UbiE